LKQDLNDLLQDGQQAAVVDAYAALEQRQQRFNLRQFFVVLVQPVESAGVNLLD
jgi:hypothetical protein